ncbi:MAG: S-adenosyl-L-methionine-dependent methyltransferase MraW [Actinomycetota bacterium]|jgi:16S rRNA (cytosine1402-N4)-methyltransferase
MSAAIFEHQPVMVAEIVDAFASVPSGCVLDATLGGGGHARALLDSRSDLSILGLDRDEAAIAAARSALANFGDRVRFAHVRFDELDAAMDAQGVSELSGALFDLGVSSHQFDEGERGFSYRSDAPLDMRMDRREGRSAQHFVNESSEQELANLLRDFADERFAGRIARAICAARPISTTTELAEIIASAIPAPARRRGGHPAKRSFQALRIAVNRELEVLPVALDKAIERTAAGGRIVVLSYHSGEDRIVKERFRFHSTGGCACPTELPCACGARPTVKIVRSPRKPSDAEQKSNPRSSSARLRVAEAL